VVGGHTPLSDLIESGEDYQIEYDDELSRLTRAALAQLKRWLTTPEAASREYKGILFRDKAESCIALLRRSGF
jgi:hypothetical protein